MVLIPCVTKSLECEIAIVKNALARSTVDNHLQSCEPAYKLVKIAMTIVVTTAECE